MIKQIQDDFDLTRICESGQCFRWEILDEPEDASTGKTCRIIKGEDCLYVTDLGGGQFDFDCSEAEFDSAWREYFDFPEDYRQIRARIDPEKDPFLWRASEAEKGIRILRQDPWETLISFIISQNKNIPAIRRSIEMLAECCGKRRTDFRGRDYYAFPGPSEIGALCEEELKACRLGYRWKYVLAAAEAVRTEAVSLDGLKDAGEPETMWGLTQLYGVGVKVASCVSLFGLHHMDAFPEDVWIKRILKEQYPEGYPFREYSPYNGVYQQYMFACYRNHGGAV